MPKEYIEYQNEITSADELNKQCRKSDVLVAALEKCEKLENEVKELKYASDMDYKDLRRFQGLLIQNKDEINKLKEQLKIAMSALFEIENMEFERYLMNNGWVGVGQMRKVAKEALKQIKELEK